MTQSNTNYFPSPVDNGKIPNAPKTLRVDFDFRAGAQSYSVDTTLIRAQGKLDIIQSIYIDNVTGANNQPVTIAVSGTNQSISVPANFQGIFPLLVTDRAAFTIESSGNGTASMFFANFQQAPFMWQGIAIPTNISGTVAVADAIIDATVSGNRVNTTSHEVPASIIDHSGQIAVGGTSQVAAAANIARLGWLLQNIDENFTENLYARLGAVAQVGGVAGSFTIFPGGSIQGVGTASINVVASTSSHKYSLIEW